MRKIILLLFVVAYACLHGSCKPSNDKVKNDIQIKEDGLHVVEAYLVNSAGQPLNDDNKVQVGDRIYLRLMIDGWQPRDGRVFFDASQKTAKSSGETLASNPSMFGLIYASGVPLEEAKLISLYQTIGRLDNPKDHVVVTFKVWDKITNKSVRGSYELYE